MLLDHAYRLAEARTYLFELGAQARTFEARIEYGRVLLQLDNLHGEETLGLLECASEDTPALYARALDAIKGLLDFGDDELSIELLLDLLAAAHHTDNPDGRDEP